MKIVMDVSGWMGNVIEYFEYLPTIGVITNESDLFWKLRKIIQTLNVN